MKRTALQRKTPLSNRKGFQRRERTVDELNAEKLVERGGLDFEAARRALTHRILAAQAVMPDNFRGPGAAPARSTKPASTGFPTVVRQTILERDNYACVRCRRPIDTGTHGYSLQHRQARAMGGTRDPRVNQAANGITACGSGTTGCHGWMEANPTEAERLGYAVASWADPTTVPVLVHDRGWVLLDNHGARTPCAAPAMNDAHAAAARKD